MIGDLARASDVANGFTEREADRHCTGRVGVLHPSVKGGHHGVAALLERDERNRKVTLRERQKQMLHEEVVPFGPDASVQ